MQYQNPKSRLLFQFILSVMMVTASFIVALTFGIEMWHLPATPVIGILVIGLVFGMFVRKIFD